MSETRKRPMRACTVKTALRLAPPAPAVERSINHRKKVEDSDLELHAPDEEHRLMLRSMWELASVINFINAFRPILNVRGFSYEELETAVLTCNTLLADVHIALLKGIHPPTRVSVGRENWITALHKKLKDRWKQVADGPFPLTGAHGTEAVVYKGLDSSVRLIILKALCEIRLDQEDVRPHMDDSVKKGNLSAFRKERICANLIGTVYWLEKDVVSGYRLYKEILPAKGKEFRGRAAPAPPASQWATVATNLEEFQAVSDALLTSKFKQEIGLGRRLKQDVLPVLEAIQKRKDKAHKRQQRQANLLEITLQENGLAGGVAGGRTKRDRKPVNYTFDDYDRSIKEAIKHTRKHAESAPPAHAVLANGHAGHFEMTRPQHKQRTTTMVSDHSDEHDVLISRQETDDGPASSEDLPAVSDGYERSQSPRSRRRKRSQRYSERDYVDAAYTEEDDLYSDDEIEGEAIYDDDFVRDRERRRRGLAQASTPDDDEYRSNEEEEPDLEEEEVGVSYSEEEAEAEETDHEEEPAFLSRPSRRPRKVKAVENIGLRRSKRVTRTRVDYRSYQDSEEDYDEEDYGGRNGVVNGKQQQQQKKRFQDADFNVEEMEFEQEPASSSHSQELPDQLPQEGDEDDEADNDVKHLNGASGDFGRKQLRFLDLNQCAPAADSPREWLMNSNVPAPG